MKTLVTGSTGFIGARLALYLAHRNHTVHALYRSIEKTAPLKHRNICLFRGDILDLESLKKAMEGCRQVYHIAAFTEVWAKDENIVYRLNVEGAVNVFETACQTGAKDVVFTSTAGVIGPSTHGVVDESYQRDVPYFLTYEQTKAQAEDKALTYVKRGLNIRIVNPTRVYGPGSLSASNGVTRIIEAYRRGVWRAIPGNGESIGNYAYIEDVVRGHVQAMERGKTGTRYILGGENCSYNRFFKMLGEVSGKRRLLIKMPRFLMRWIAYAAEAAARWGGGKPFIVAALVKKFYFNWEVSSAKAERELGYAITPLRTGIKNTLQWLKESNV